MTDIPETINQEISKNRFRAGEIYTRKSVYPICFPGKTWDKGGPWATGYATAGKKLIIFMNIGICSRTGHDYENSYDPDLEEIMWCGKALSNQGQPTMQGIINFSLAPHFFARWDQKPQFKYLVIGLMKSFKENYPSKMGPLMRYSFQCVN